MVFADKIIPKSNFALLLGDASYSIYLTQILSLPVVAKVWTALGLGFGFAGTPAFMISGLAAAILAGCLTYWYVEVPLLALARSITGPRQPPPAPALL